MHSSLPLTLPFANMRQISRSVEALELIRSLPKVLNSSSSLSWGSGRQMPAWLCWGGRTVPSGAAAGRQLQSPFKHREEAKTQNAPPQAVIILFLSAPHWFPAEGLMTGEDSFFWADKAWPPLPQRRACICLHGWPAVRCTALLLTLCCVLSQLGTCSHVFWGWN